MPKEVRFKGAHQVGIELCEKILKGKYEYVLAIHIDKDQEHNLSVIDQETQKRIN